jgi:hypothetical protein
MAPPGHHVMSCFVQYAPYDIEGGWDDAKRDAFGETVISTIEKYAPNIRQCIVGKQVITPKDIERIAGITGGNIFHGELLLHQLFFFRPAPQWADFRTPLPGYYFGASGAHPGRRRDGRCRQVGGGSRAEGWRLTMSSSNYGRNRHRCRPQRPGRRELPGQGRQEGFSCSSAVTSPVANWLVNRSAMASWPTACTRADVCGPISCATLA